MAKNEDILDLAAERFQLALDADRDERELADDDIRFALNDEGDQWPAALRKKREDDGRPCLVINKILEKIDQVEGEFKQLKPSIKVRAVDNMADPKVAEIIAGLLRHVEYDSNARTAYNTSHTSVLYCGRGAWRIDLVDSEDDPFVRDIKINRIPNVLTVYWDPFAKAADLSDADYMFVTEIIGKKEYKKQYGDDIAHNWPDGEEWDNWSTDEGYRIAEYWWREKTKKTFYRVARMMEDTEKVFTVTEPGPQDIVLEEKTADWYKVQWCKMIAGKIIEGPHDFESRYIPIIMQFGKETNVRGQVKNRGMVRNAKDPQRMYNYWVSSATEQVALAPKSPYLVTPAMIMQYKNIWDQANEKNWAYLPFEPDPMLPGGVPRREPAPQLGTAYQNMMAIMEHDIMTAMGIYAAMLGDKSNESSGIAIQARQRQGNIGSYPFTDAFHTALTHSSKILIDLIPKVYDTERVVRILGPDEEEDMVPINAQPGVPLPQAQQLPEKYQIGPRPGITEYLNDITVGKYDVVVSIGPSYTTQREETLAVLLDMVRTAPGLAINIMDLIVQSMDMPHSEELVKRLRRMVPLGIRDPEPDEKMPEQQPDPQLILGMAELELKKAELQIKEFTAQTKAVLDLATAESKEVGTQLEAMTAAMQELRAKIELDHNMQTKQQELGMQAQQMQAQQQPLPEMA